MASEPWLLHCQSSSPTANNVSRGNLKSKFLANRNEILNIIQYSTYNTAAKETGIDDMN